MEGYSIITFVSLAFGLGFLHALDADHVMAVTGLASSHRQRDDWWRLSLRWAGGHGLSLLGIGSAVLLLGLAIPKPLVVYAEGVVGLVLVGLGAYVLSDLSRRHIHLHFHHHDDLPPHAHLHAHGGQLSHQAHKSNPHAHHHGAVMIGVLHGAAGSAPILALLPLSRIGSPWIGIAYLLLFGLGTLVAMLIFGGLLGQFVLWLQRWGDGLVKGLRAAVGIISISLGLTVILGTI